MLNLVTVPEQLCSFSYLIVRQTQERGVGVGRGAQHDYALLLLDI